MTLHSPPPIDSQRAMTVMAFDALITVSLTSGGEMRSFTARGLVERLHAAGLADVTSTADSLTMVLCGIKASAHGGTALALLRNWQSAARDSAAQGVRR